MDEDVRHQLECPECAREERERRAQMRANGNAGNMDNINNTRVADPAFNTQNNAPFNAPFNTPNTHSDSHENPDYFFGLGIDESGEEFAFRVKLIEPMKRLHPDDLENLIISILEEKNYEYGGQISCDCRECLSGTGVTKKERSS